MDVSVIWWITTIIKEIMCGVDVYFKVILKIISVCGGELVCLHNTRRVTGVVNAQLRLVSVA